MRRAYAIPLTQTGRHRHWAAPCTRRTNEVNRISSIVATAAVSVCATVSFAQTTTTGAISGLITDQSSAVIANATVTLTDTATHASQKARSTASGSYRFDLLAPGTYAIEVEAPGFAKLGSQVIVNSSQVVAADLKLAVGSDSQTIEVSTVAALINSENGNVATTVNQTQVEEVPNSGNNLLFETKITPGFNTGFGTTARTLYQVDGQNFNDPYNNANNSGASNLTLGLNDVQEATIIANGYSGQYGGLAGATASFVTKSGANRFHGNASWFWTGRSLVANSYSHKVNALTSGITNRSFENANQWSALISGPVVIPHLIHGKDRLFFLADAEGLRAVLPATSTTVLLPSQNFQTYTLKKLTARGLSNSIPFYQNLFNIYNAAGAAHGVPVNAPGSATGNPNASSANITYNNLVYNHSVTGCGTLDATDTVGLGNLPGACTNYYSSTATTFANEALQTYRADAVLTEHDRMFVRYRFDSGTQPTNTDPLSSAFNAISIQPQHSGQLNETHVFGAKATNNFILAGLWYGALFGPQNLPASLAVFPAQMAFTDSSLATVGGSNASFPTGRNITTVQVQDDFALSQGAHTLKFGGKGYFITENDHYFTAGTVPSIGVTTMGAFVNGGVDPLPNLSPTTFAATTTISRTNFTQSFPSRPNYRVGYNQWAAYAEDDWKANRALSVSFALRVEHQGNISCRQNCLTQLSSPFLSLNHLASIPYNQAYSFNQSNSLFNLQQLEWQPRVGFAYNPPIMHDSLVVRGGFGIFYDGLAGNLLEGIAKNPPTKNTFTNVNGDNLANTETTNLFSDTAALNSAFQAGVTSGGTVASIKASLPTSLQPFFTSPTVYTSQPNFHMAYIEKWNLEVQKQFGKRDVLSLNYMGNHGVHLAFTNAGLNAFSANGSIKGLPTAQPDTRFGPVYYYQSGGAANYTGLIISATHKFDGGSLITAGYTLGKALDTGANGFSTTTATGTTDIGGPVNPYNPNGTYGPANNDERHNFVMNYVYKLPFRNPFYGGWEVSGIAFAYSGLPFSVIDTTTTSNISGYATGAYGASLLANYNGGGQKRCDYGKDQCLLASQFSPATSVTSNQGRNQFRGPKYITTDLAVTKSIPLHWEGGRLAIAAQAFNVLNHLNFSRPTGSLSSGTFGQVTSVVNPSGIFSGVGGDDSPRILQLKAKIEF